MSKLKLNCWIYGTHDLFFPVKIKATETVADLKIAIKAENTHSFQSIDAYFIDLWNVSILYDDHFEENLKKFDVNSKPRLTARIKLSSLFSDRSADDRLDIVIRAPGFSPRHIDPEPPQLLQLNCLIVEHEAERIFRVEIETGKTVVDLKKRIKEESKPTMDHIPANVLDLWKVSHEIDNNFQGCLEMPAERPLLPIMELSEVFPEYPARKHLHILVNVPPVSRRSKKGPPNSFKPPPIENVGALRAKFLGRSPSKPPSAGGKPKAFSTRQAIPGEMLYCNRPQDASATIPAALLHSVFGQFIDDCENYEPTQKDNAFVLVLSEAMSQFYQDENARANEITRLLGDYDLPFVRTQIAGTNYLTDGDINRGNFRLAHIEMKNEVGSKGAEPFLQSLLYYLESTRSQAPMMPNSVLPCIIINIFGPHMSFAGVAWNLRPVAQVLSPTLPFHFHLSDNKLKTMVARYLGALKNAIRTLEHYYTDELPAINASSSLTDPPCQMFPYRRHFTSLVDSTIQEFEYVAQLSEAHLVFFGKLSNGHDICIKFTQEYSQKMHQFCASKGFAPNVLGCERIPGGWWMVVMDKIEEDYVEFHQAPRVSVLENLKCFLDCLHQEGFVHGDLRDTNIMVPRSGESHFLLVDFDWGGRIGEVRYPMNVYRGRGLWRPEGVCDGHLILAKHDDEMLKYMFSIYGTDVDNDE